MDLKIAREIASGLARGLGTEEIALTDALFRVPGEDVIPMSDIPGEFRSRWDGFALCSADIRSAAPQKPVVLDIAPGTFVAGASPKAVAAHEESRGRCYRIMTGAVLPKGADAVIASENASGDEERLIFFDPVPPGRGVLAPGSDAAAGEVILKKGDLLTPSLLALVASTGMERITVRRRPRVAILATGDELIEPGQSARSAGIYCNNIHLLSAMVSARGGEPVSLGISRDDPDEILSRLENDRSDLVITTGGMGRGSRDFILEVWARLGVSIRFDSLNVSPGKGSALGTIGDRIFLALPGNPWAARIVFEEIASPVILQMQGEGFSEGAVATSILARTTSELTGKKDFYQAIRGFLENSGGEILFNPARPSAKTRLFQFIRTCPAYTMLSPGQTIQEQGVVEVKVPDLPMASFLHLHHH